MLTSLQDLKQMVPRALCEMSSRKLKVNTRPLCGPLPTSHFGIPLFPPFLISHIPGPHSSLCAQRPPTEHYRPPRLCACSFFHLVWPCLPSSALLHLPQEDSAHLISPSSAPHVTKAQLLGVCPLFMKSSLTIGTFLYCICKLGIKSQQQNVHKEHCRHPTNIAGQYKALYCFYTITYLLLSPFYSWRGWGKEVFKNLPQATQLEFGSNWIWT